MADASQVGKITERIRPMLAGHPPELQGAVLADLLGLWLAGHPNHMREQLLQAHLTFVRQLIAVNEKILFGDTGHPSNTQ